MSGDAPAIYYDGVAARPRPVGLGFADDALELREGDAAAGSRLMSR
jgi:hypothetical protein